MKIIGITGRAGAGKDTVAEIILDRVEGAKREGFADRLKLSAARLFYPDIGLEGAVAWANIIKVNGDVTATLGNDGARHWNGAGATGRQFLQRYGTEAHRDVFGQDFWLDAVLPVRSEYAGPGADFKRCLRDDCKLLVIPDVRFPNEAQRVLDCGGVLWRVERPGLDAVASHSSETPIPDRLVSWVIWNTGTIEELRQPVGVGLDAVFA